MGLGAPPNPPPSPVPAASLSRQQKQTSGGVDYPKRQSGVAHPPSPRPPGCSPVAWSHAVRRPLHVANCCLSLLLSACVCCTKRKGISYGSCWKKALAYNFLLMIRKHRRGLAGRLEDVRRLLVETARRVRSRQLRSGSKLSRHLVWIVVMLVYIDGLGSNRLKWLERGNLCLPLLEIK